MAEVIYISYDGMTDPLGQSQVLPYIIGLSKQGYTFHLISCEKPDRYAANKNIIEKICADNKIIWHPIMYTKNPPVLSTLKDIYSINKKVKAITATHNIKLIHCRSYISSLIGLGFKQKHHIPFVFDMRGFWADERVDGGLWNLDNPLFKKIYNFFKQKEKEFMQQSAAIISLTHIGKAEMLRWNYSVDSNKINVIPCCADEQLFNAANYTLEKTNALKANLNIPDNHTVYLYLGSVGTWYLTNELMQFFKITLDKNANSTLLFVTADSKEEVVNYATINNVQNNIVIAKATRQEVPLYIACCNYGLFFIKPSYSKKSSSPTKKAEILFMNKPIICNANVGDTATMVQENNWGFVAPELNEKSFSTLVEEIQLNNFNNNNIREQALQIFSLRQGVQSYAAIYKNIIG